MTKQEEMLAMIDTELGMPIVREIARWFVCGYSENWATQVELLDGAAVAPAFMDELSDLGPKPPMKTFAVSSTSP